jgi:hypothetical protein
VNPARPAAAPGAARRRAAAGLALAALASAAGACFTLGITPPSELYLRPAVQRMGPQQVVGNAVVTSIEGAAISFEPLTPDQMDAFYHNRPGLVNPLKSLKAEGPPPVTFRVIARNRGRQAVQIEPAMFTLTDQEGQRTRPMQYQDFYQLLSELPDAEVRLRSVQATALSTFLTVSPGTEREGFLFFPPPIPTARLLVLELESFYVGAKDVPLVAEFEVVRPKGSPARR